MKKKRYNLFAWIDESISGGPIPTLELYLSTKGPKSAQTEQPTSGVWTFHSRNSLYRKIIELQRIWDVLLPLELEIQLQKFINKGGHL